MSMNSFLADSFTPQGYTKVKQVLLWDTISILQGWPMHYFVFLSLNRCLCASQDKLGYAALTKHPPKCQCHHF